MDRVHSLQKCGASIGELAWYCLRTQPKHEHIAAVRLRGIEGVTVLCPRIRYKRPTRQGLAWVTEAMFPGYLFARFDLFEKHREVQYAHGVRNIVRFADRYPTIDERVLESLRIQSGVGEITELDDVPSQGTQVRIVSGAFHGLEAVVTQVLSAGERVKVLMNFLGRELEAEMERSNVLRRTVHPLAA